MTSGLKHLVTCRCTLPQFKRSANPPLHQFTVFSVIGDDDKVIPKYAQCNNCGIVHRVVEINRSDIISGKESAASILTIEDIKTSMHPRLADILEANSCDVPTWEMAKYIWDNKRWRVRGVGIGHRCWDPLRQVRPPVGREHVRRGGL